MLLKYATLNLMRRLVKLLALFALVIVVAATLRAFQARVSGIAPDEGGTPPSGTICLHWKNGRCEISSNRSKPAASDPDVNIKLRQFAKVPGTLDLINFVHDIDAAPQLCQLFSSDGSTKTAFTALYGVGLYNGGIDGTGKMEQDPPHLAGFEVSRGQTIHAPPLTAYGGGGIGNGYAAMVIYADDNSLTLKYTLEDDVVSGYAIHIIGISVAPNLKSLYDQANADGRWYLPGVTGGQVLGKASGQELWVSIRDTGQFMDPRWRNDWWKNCTGSVNPKTSLTKISNPPGYTSTPATPISGGGPTQTGGKFTPPIFPPLGSLEVCPSEIPVWGKTVKPTSLPKQSTQAPPSSATCGLTPIPEPAECATGEARDSCSRESPLIWCYPSSCQGEVLEKIANACGISTNAAGAHCGRYVRGYCDDNTSADAYWLNRARVQGGCDKLNDGDKEVVARCLAYKGGSQVGSVVGNNILPACVPASVTNQKCVSECSEPISLTENLRLFADQGCLRNGDCLAKIGITNNKFSLPFVSALGDYFTGVLDAEHQSSTDLDRLQNILRQGATNPAGAVEEIFQKAGVARKILPADYQDKLKCQFIDYVKSKKRPNADGSYPNTKYLGHTADGKLDGTEFQIYDTKITDIPCRLTAKDKTDFDQTWGKYWFAVPLFADDDSQGKIEFVSPSLFSTEELGNDPKFPKNNLGPIYVSLPGVARLASATAVVQSALVPPEMIEGRAAAIAADPKNNLPTYGKAIDPKVPIAACVSAPWSNYYTGTTLTYDPTQSILSTDKDTAIKVPGKSGANLTEYSRAVTCDLNAITGKGDQVCVVGPDGQLRCYQQEKGAAPSAGISKNYPETVQVRTVFPNLFEIGEQTIEKSTGVLRIFKPSNVNTLNTLDNAGINTAIPSGDVFEQNYAPIPAQTFVKYDLSDQDITLSPPPRPAGWQIFFYKLGGVLNARDFVLKLLNP